MVPEVAADCSDARHIERVALLSGASSASGGRVAPVAEVSQKQPALFSHFCELRRVALRKKWQGKLEQKEKKEKERAAKSQQRLALINRGGPSTQKELRTGIPRVNVRTSPRRRYSQQMTIAASYLDSGGAVRCRCMPSLAKLAERARGVSEHLAILRALTRTAKGVRGRATVERFFVEDLQGLKAVRRWMAEAAAAPKTHESLEVLHHSLDLLRAARLPGHRAHAEGLHALCRAVAKYRPQMRLFTAELLAGWGPVQN
eukprot:TRINITY_DN58360_c0_g1_i1.p1 TRINITY_DN58360_c0_g1~~TRINITY_DN58360_c0_g1_i1.p1  ORF type:complete len:259 (-),score=39.98 TRINITY_DN58360_c0_g1_i1:206-982(-)